MQFINITERMPTDIHRSYWCRIQLNPLSSRKKSQVPHMKGIGQVLSKDETKQRNSEVVCLPLRIYHQEHDMVINGETAQSAGYYFATEAVNIAHFAQTIEWLEDDGATPSDQLVDPPHSYKMEKLKEIENPHNLKNEQNEQ